MKSKIIKSPVMPAGQKQVAINPRQVLKQIEPVGDTILSQPGTNDHLAGETTVSVIKNADGVVTSVDIFCRCGEKITLVFDY